MTHSTRLSRSLCLLLAFYTFQASANLIVEQGDAGEFPSSAQALPGGTSSVAGSVRFDADLFSFFWGGGAFYVNSIGSQIDSQLFLFDASGAGILGNDDGIAFAGPAYLSGELAMGAYYLGISGWDRDPYSSAGMIFPSYPYDALYTADNEFPLQSWEGSGQWGDYLINFQQVTASGAPVGLASQTSAAPLATVPAPASILLCGIGLLGLARQTSRRS